MAIDLLSLKPHQISRQLNGYITFVYGQAGVGKTTLASHFPKPLLLAFERGYNALAGIVAQDVTSWGEMRQVVRELKKPEVQNTFSTIIIDTADVASDLCQKYICSQLGIENIGDGGWTNNGWARYKKELEEVFRSITMMGYALIFISHAKEKAFKRTDGSEYTMICPTVQSSACSILEAMSDIYGYAYPSNKEGTSKRYLMLRSADGTVACKSRFKYIATEIELGYEELVKALNDAIDAEAKASSGEYVTDAPEAIVTPKEYDYDSLMDEFQSICGSLVQKNAGYYGPRITQIVEHYLGRDKKCSDATRDQAEFIHLIVEEIKSDLLNK